jgi:hypothetical protein
MKLTFPFSGQIYDDAAPVFEVQVQRQVQHPVREGPDGRVLGQGSQRNPGTSTSGLACRNLTSGVQFPVLSAEIRVLV